MGTHMAQYLTLFDMEDHSIIDDNMFYLHQEGVIKTLDSKAKKENKITSIKHIKGKFTSYYFVLFNMKPSFQKIQHVNIRKALDSYFYEYYSKFSTKGSTNRLRCKADFVDTLLAKLDKTGLVSLVIIVASEVFMDSKDYV